MTSDRDASIVLLREGSTLPALPKGYELYAWEEGGALSFTLISWTQGGKELKDLTSFGPDYRDRGWVVLHGRGLPKLQQTLARVPHRTSVIFESFPKLPPLSEATQATIVSALLARTQTDETSSDAAVFDDIMAKAAGAFCRVTGGQIDTAYCCMSSSAFPDTCVVGACGCAPEHSRLTEYCVCPDGQCYSAREGCKAR